MNSHHPSNRHHPSRGGIQKFAKHLAVLAAGFGGHMEGMVGIGDDFALTTSFDVPRAMSKR